MLAEEENLIGAKKCETAVSFVKLFHKSDGQ
jgi:hypothetical protein